MQSLLFTLLLLVSSAHAAPLKGHLDGHYYGEGNYYVSGWACLEGNNPAINVLFYVGSQFIGIYPANVSAEAAVGVACKDTKSSAHRFKIPMNAAFRKTHAAKSIRVLAFGGNAVLELPRSGIPKVPVPINTLGGWSDSPHLSRDGKRLYFMYSRYDFSPWIRGDGDPELRGPDRIGLQKSTLAWAESDIFVATKRADGSWTEAVAMPFNRAYGDASGMEFLDGKGFVWLQGTGDSRTNRIRISTKDANGNWSAPQDLGPNVNHDSFVQDNPHISPDGKFLFFSAERGSERKDTWFSFFNGREWSLASLVPFLSGPGEQDQIFLTSRGEIFWNDENHGLRRCVSNGSGCAGAPEPVVIPGCPYAAEASLPEDGSVIYFACGNHPSPGSVTLMYAKRLGENSWGQAIPLD